MQSNKIKDLAMLAGLSPEGSLDNFNYNQFAHLIIKRCVMVAMQNDDPNTAQDIDNYFRKKND